ncbi:MAG: selenide, water dikinase SelD [Bacteroidetes bacterium]|nr:selenide, water dikinase SelD [Bacteroidota bacterium]
MTFDLLTTVEQGGCSVKLPAKALSEVLKGIPMIHDENLLVGTEAHDDAGVYKLRDDYALILTTDFFPPVCSDPYDFGQIAAANALSDVYAMGGQVLTALNLMMFPAGIPLEVLAEILKGGQDKVVEAGGVIAGGHTITDDTPKYGLAVTGWVHPEKLVTNAAAEAGDLLLLTKPIGTGVMISARRNALCTEKAYQTAIDNMKLLNKRGAAIMNNYGIRCATDITGYGLAGHSIKLAMASGVTLRIRASSVPVLPETLSLIEAGCIPGAAFRNLDFAEQACTMDKGLGYNEKMLLMDAQTSGGLLICVKPGDAENIIEDLRTGGYPSAEIIGEVVPGKKGIMLEIEV